MANDKAFKIKNGLSAGRYLGSAGTETAGANGPYGTFDTSLYTGNATARTITNNIDLSTDGGLVWLKARSTTGHNHLADTERGGDKWIYTNLTQGQDTVGYITSFNSDGFSLNTSAAINASGTDYVAWTFKKASNFFDVVTYTGTGSGATVNHNLGVIPACVIIKSLNTSGADDWYTYHISVGTSGYLMLNQTSATTSRSNWISVTDSTFTVDALAGQGSTDYVAYLFAHDTSADGYIQCGSYTGNGSTTGPEIDLGWEPSWLLVKRASSAEFWQIVDNVRGVTTGGNDAILYPNATNAEVSTNVVSFTSTGFQPTTTSASWNGSGDTYIYVAIRAVGQTQTLDLSTGHTFSITPTEALDVLFTNPPASGIATAFTLEVDNSAGGYALTWPSSVKWHLGTAPTATASKEVYTFITTDGGTTYYGKLAGKDIA